ncbi:GlxA family transcriptional regulator [Roseibium sp. MMSF_3544]|uniref:GlxA family transcriptional regulator n=1 Tax=unclassified Roseibium TaxID=2629323 RepID=UPI00273D54EB|nr:helix-turn-helix domain-containing protein [Roseibium sp. MMSF_3544]
MKDKMTSISANFLDADCDARRVLFVVYPNIVLLDLVGPLQVFSHAPDLERGKVGYSCAVTSVAGDLVETNTVVAIPSEPIDRFLNLDIHTLVIVGGDGALSAMFDEALLKNIRHLASRAQRVGSVCSGALVLAAAGLLDGRRAVTHWEDCDMLQNEFPAVCVEMDPIFIKDGDVWTSAGITAGIDMALAIVTEDLGRQSALEVARSMVTHMARSGGQSQFSPVLGRQLRDATGRFEQLHQWVAENLKADLRVEALADRANMSPRNFARQYSAQMGLTPAKAVEAIRLEVARDLLETSGRSIKQVAVQCGFNDEERMRRAFVRVLGVAPSDYRRSFRTE